MKWIGQHIWDKISRFRDDIYLEDISSGTIASGGYLGLDSDNKIVKASETGDITGVTLIDDADTSASVTSGNAQFTIAGGSGIDTSISSTTVTIAGEDATTSNKGVASFASADGDAVSGSSHAITMNGGEGIDVTGDGSSTISISGEDASTSNKGVASFTSGDFTASSGAISLADTVVKTLGSDSGSTTPEGHEVVIAGGNGIDTSGANAIITVTAETASDTNQGVVELATTAEADTGTDTARAITAAGLESHVSARYCYQYVNFIGNSDIATNWAMPTANGAFANNWSTDTGEAGTTVNSTNIDLGRGYTPIGFTVPFASVLVGFYGTMRNLNNNNQGALGLFHTAGSNVWGTTGTANYKLQAYAVQGYSGGAGTNYKGGCYVTDVSRSLALTAGDIIIPAALETTTDKVYFQMTMILKTLIPT